MDSSIIAAISAILGTTVGGLSTFATTLLNQRYAMRRDLLAKDVANREQLYSEFLKEVGNLYFDSVNRTLDDTSQQASLPVAGATTKTGYQGHFGTSPLSNHA